MNCVGCGAGFSRAFAVQYCSRSCWTSAQNHQRHGDPLTRLMRKVEKTEGCWNWNGCVNSEGYGEAHYKARTWKVHKILYELLVAPVPEGLELDHLCRNRRCVNPSHLEPVTHFVNTRRGEVGRNNRAKTHCPSGHEYTPDNTRSSHQSNGSTRRHCKSCNSQKRK